MYHFIQTFHSVWAYFALFLLLSATINALAGMSSKKEFTKKNRTIALLGLVATHIQLVIGLIVWVVSPLGKEAFGLMKDADLRLTSLEHPLVNIIAITLITIGWSRHKRAATSEGKFKSIGIFYALGLLLILSRIPWKLWL